MQAKKMESLLTLISYAVVVFASTNIDDVFVLLGFFADPQFRAREVILGQYAGISTLYLASVIISLSSLVVPHVYIGLLGFAPIAIGVKKLFDLWRGQEKNEKDLERHPSSFAHGKVLAVTAVTIANGGDNIGVCAPLFATSVGYEVPVIGIVFAVMTGVWCVVARWLVKHPALGAPIRRYGHRVVPFALIALGVRILLA